MKNILFLILLLSYSINAQNHMLVGEGSASGCEYDNDEICAWVTKIEDNGDTAPSSGQLGDIDDMVSALKTDGIWSTLDVFYLFAQDGSKGAGEVNMVDPDSYGLTEPGSSVTWTSDVGITPYISSDNKYYNSNYNPNTAGGNFSQNDAHLTTMVSNSNITSSVVYFAGAIQSTYFIRMYLYSPSDLRLYAYLNSNGQTTITVTRDSNNHMLSGSRTGATTYNSYIDGGSAAANSSPSTGVPNYNIYIGALNNGGSLAGGAFATPPKIQIACWGGSLTSGEISDLWDTLNTYIDGL